MVGENKLSRVLDGTGLLTYSYNNIKASNVEQFIVVSSKENHAQANSLSDPYPKIVLLDNKNQGIGDSIALAVSNIADTISSVIICLADMPLITKNHINLLILSKLSNKFRGLSRFYNANGQPGHPILFDQQYIAKLKMLTGDIGGSNILKENNNLVHRINVNNFSVTTDLDTQDDWNTFLKSNNDKVYFDN